MPERVSWRRRGKTIQGMNYLFLKSRIDYMLKMLPSWVTYLRTNISGQASKSHCCLLFVVYFRFTHINTLIYFNTQKKMHEDKHKPQQTCPKVKWIYTSVINSLWFIANSCSVLGPRLKAWVKQMQSAECRCNVIIAPTFLCVHLINSKSIRVHIRNRGILPWHFICNRPTFKFSCVMPGNDYLAVLWCNWQNNVHYSSHVKLIMTNFQYFVMNIFSIKCSLRNIPWVATGNHAMYFSRSGRLMPSSPWVLHNLSLSKR